MKRLFLSLLVLSLFLLAACGGGPKPGKLPAGVSGNLSVLFLGADTTGLTADQVALVGQTLAWMERDQINVLKRKGFNAARIADAKDFRSYENGYLLKVAITDHKMIPKGARFMVGMMAGADRLNAHYELFDSRGRQLLAWDDVQASTKGGTYCAQTLNRNAAEKVAAQLGMQ
jgi:hypothetical protein